MSDLPVLDFFVPGKPVPAGSKSPFVFKTRDGQPVRRAGGSIACGVRDSSGARLEAWRKVVTATAREVWGGTPTLTGPLAVKLRFVLDRPKSHYGTGRNAAFLRPTAPDHPICRPDVLKLSRAVEDALEGVVYYDDAQIVQEMLTKRYALCGDPTGTGCAIEVCSL